MLAPITSVDRLRLFHSRGEFAFGPRNVVLEITRRIDEDWSRWSGCTSDDGRNELPTNEACRLIDQIASFPKPPTLVLSGGDPLARQDIFQLIEHATRVGLRVNVRLVATPLVTRSVLRRLQQAGVGMISLRMDGCDAESHDVGHVPGSFDQTLQIMACASDLGIPVQVDTYVANEMLSSWNKVAHILATNQVAVWTVVFPTPTNPHARLTYEEYEGAYERLWAIARRYPFLVKTVSAPHYSRFVIQHQHPHTWSDRIPLPQRSPVAYIPPRLNDGRGMMFIDHSGGIHPSEALPLLCGIFPLNNVVEIYEDSPIFTALRDANRLEGKCGRCEFRNICGGSRAHAYAVTGNPLAQDPDCKYVPQTLRN